MSDRASDPAREVCRGFRNNGTCRFGDKCKFEHSEGDPITDWEARPAEICHTFRDDGSCARGDACRFIHGASAKDDPRFNSETGVRDVSEEACRNFKRGKCVLGEACPRKHEAFSESAQQAPGAEAEAERKKSASTSRPRRGNKGRGKAQRNKGSATGGAGPHAARRRLTNADAAKPVEQQICQNYKNGRCRLENCPRIHEGEVEQRRVNKIDEVCRNFREGKCRFGDQCRRRHE